MFPQVLPVLWTTGSLSSPMASLIISSVSSFQPVTRSCPPHWHNSLMLKQLETLMENMQGRSKYTYFPSTPNVFLHSPIHGSKPGNLQVILKKHYLLEKQLSVISLSKSVLNVMPKKCSILNKANVLVILAWRPSLGHVLLHVTLCLSTIFKAHLLRSLCPMS